MKKQNTRRALLMSALSILLCVSMLVGTTFAWFTDEVKSGTNQIIAGNLDVDVVTADGVSIQDQKTLFDEIKLWEPGVVAYENLTVKNLGNLTLKYQMEVNFENASQAKNGKTLADALKVAIVPGGVDGALTREALVASLADEWQPLESFVQPGVLDTDKDLLADDEIADTYGLVIYWEPTAADNDFNMNNAHQGTVLTIDLGVRLVATQMTAELDSWGKDYDEGLNPQNTYIFGGTSLHQSTTSSGKFALGGDITTSANGAEGRYGYGYEYIVRKGADYTLDLNGKTINHDTVNENANHNALTYLLVANHAGTKLTINGNGTVYSHNDKGYACAVQGKDGTLITINGGDYLVENGIAVWAGAGAHIVINGGSFVNSKAQTDHELIYSSGGVIDIYGGFFHNTDGNHTLNVEDRNRATSFINVYGGTFVNFDPSTGGQDPNNIKVANGYKVVSETQSNGDVWYSVVPENASN